jgi:hypothetical protein
MFAGSFLKVVLCIKELVVILTLSASQIPYFFVMKENTTDFFPQYI